MKHNLSPHISPTKRNLQEQELFSERLFLMGTVIELNRYEGQEELDTMTLLLMENLQKYIVRWN